MMVPVRLRSERRIHVINPTISNLVPRVNV
jgi:hypothetical protein